MEQFEQHIHDDGTTQQQRLAHWLLEVMRPSSSTLDDEAVPTTSISSAETDIALMSQDDYHPAFYQQLPDFVFALLSNDAQAATHYAPLLYHMLGCRSCHQGFLELYDAMREALYPAEPRPRLGQGTRTLEAMPATMLEHLCQVWISQAEAVLRQGRRDDTPQDAMARQLLQQAIHLSAHIAQYNVRRQALHDLVRVATLFDDAYNSQEKPHEQATYAYTPILTGGRTMRRTEIPLRGKDATAQNQPLTLQARAVTTTSTTGEAGIVRTIESTVTQQDQLLTLHLHSLDATLHGSPIVVSVLLGSLLEPVRWSGGNPLAIRSTAQVDATGSVTLPLGETELHLNIPEERNLLEAILLLVEVRRAS